MASLFFTVYGAVVNALAFSGINSFSLSLQIMVKKNEKDMI